MLTRYVELLLAVPVAPGTRISTPCMICHMQQLNIRSILKCLLWYTLFTTLLCLFYILIGLPRPTCLICQWNSKTEKAKSFSEVKGVYTVRLFGQTVRAIYIYTCLPWPRHGDIVLFHRLCKSNISCGPCIIKPQAQSLKSSLRSGSNYNLSHR